MLINRSFIVFLSFLSAIAVSAQEIESAQDEFEQVSEVQLRDIINKRSETIPGIKKKDMLLDSLMLQVEDLTYLVSLLDEQLDSLNESLNKPYEIDYSVWPLPLLSEDESVFKLGNINGRIVPPSLKRQYNIVCIVADIDSLLDSTDHSIAEITTFANEKNLNSNELIQQSIESDIAKLLELFTQLQNCDTSSLSDKQAKYIDGLKQRYNNYSVYYE